MRLSAATRALRPTQRGRWSMTVVLVAAILVLVAVAALVARARTPGRGVVVGLSAVSPYLMLAAPVALVGLLAVRYWAAAVVAAVVTLLCVLTQLPLYVATTAPGATPRLLVMTANLKLGEAAPSDVVDAVRRDKVDVLMLEELTPAEHDALSRAGLDRLLPHSLANPRTGAAGTGLYSRYPLIEPRTRTDFAFAFITARIAVPGTDVRPTLAAAHMPGPWPQASGPWQQDIAHLPKVLDELATDGTVILGGDLNATPDVKQFRRLLTDGYHDAAEQAGAGMTRSYPSDRWFPPLIAIDHVLTHDAVATSAKTVEIRGSDHRALVVTVALRPGG